GRIAVSVQGKGLFGAVRSRRVRIRTKRQSASGIPESLAKPMKSFPTHLYYFLRNRPARRNVINLMRFFGILAGLVTLYSVLFHYIMAFEGRSYSWITGFYWTLTVMSTLGFGDITFESDLGRIFSSIVLM